MSFTHSIRPGLHKKIGAHQKPDLKAFPELADIDSKPIKEQVAALADFGLKNPDFVEFSASKILSLDYAGAEQFKLGSSLGAVANVGRLRLEEQQPKKAQSSSKIWRAKKTKPAPEIPQEIKRANLQGFLSGLSVALDATGHGVAKAAGRVAATALALGETPETQAEILKSGSHTVRSLTNRNGSIDLRIELPRPSDDSLTDITGCLAMGKTFESGERSPENLAELMFLDSHLALDLPNPGPVKALKTLAKSGWKIGTKSEPSSQNPDGSWEEKGILHGFNALKDGKETSIVWKRGPIERVFDNEGLQQAAQWEEDNKSSLVTALSKSGHVFADQSGYLTPWEAEESANSKLTVDGQYLALDSQALFGGNLTEKQTRKLKNERTFLNIIEWKESQGLLDKGSLELAKKAVSLNQSSERTSNALSPKTGPAPALRTIAHQREASRDLNTLGEAGWKIGQVGESGFEELGPIAGLQSLLKADSRSALVLQLGDNESTIQSLEALSKIANSALRESGLHRMMRAGFTLVDTSGESRSLTSTASFTKSLKMGSDTAQAFVSPRSFIYRYQGRLDGFQAIIEQDVKDGKLPDNSLQQAQEILNGSEAEAEKREALRELASGGRFLPKDAKFDHGGEYAGTANALADTSPVTLLKHTDMVGRPVLSLRGAVDAQGRYEEKFHFRPAEGEPQSWDAREPFPEAALEYRQKLRD